MNAVYFSPKDDITLQDLVEILQRTIFRSTGYIDGAYAAMPPELQRHFEVRENLPRGPVKDDE